MYIELILFINFFYDFVILLFVNFLLKRNIKIKRIILGSIFGTFLLFTLFLNINNYILLLIKFILSIIMIYITFGRKDIKYNFDNVLYFYSSSIILGGILYLLKENINIKILSDINYKLNYIVLVILSPLFLFIYIKQVKKIKNNYNLYYEISIKINKKNINLIGYLDTGNTLIEPYKKRGVIITNNKLIKKYILNNNYFLVPYNTIGNNGLMKCISINKIYIKNIGYVKDVVIGYIDNSIKMNGVDLILNNKILEDYNV